MRQFLIIIFFFFSIISLAQNPYIADSLKFYGISNKSITSIDSFTFCFIKYKVPRDCDSKNQSNCCSANLNPHLLQLGCYDGTALFWDYFVSEQIARDNFESLPVQWEKQMKKLDKIPITCYLINKEVKGYKVSYETHQGHKGHYILTYGVVNGQAVLLQLSSSKELKSNKNIQPVIRQIVRLTQ